MAADHLHDAYNFTVRLLLDLLERAELYPEIEVQV